MLSNLEALEKRLNDLKAIRNERFQGLMVLDGQIAELAYHIQELNKQPETVETSEA